MIPFEVRNPRFIDGNDEAIHCEIKHPVDGWIGFAACSYDPVEYGRAIHDAIKRGDYGPISPAPARPGPSEEELKESVRAELRDHLAASPPADIHERLRLLEVIVGVRDPEEKDYAAMVNRTTTR